MASSSEGDSTSLRRLQPLIKFCEEASPWLVNILNDASRRAEERLSVAVIEAHFERGCLLERALVAIWQLVSARSSLAWTSKRYLDNTEPSDVAWLELVAENRLTPNQREHICYGLGIDEWEWSEIVGEARPLLPVLIEIAEILPFATNGLKIVVADAIWDKARQSLRRLRRSNDLSPRVGIFRAIVRLTLAWQMDLKYRTYDSIPIFRASEDFMEHWMNGEPSSWKVLRGYVEQVGDVAALRGKSHENPGHERGAGRREQGLERYERRQQM